MNHTQAFFQELLTKTSDQTINDYRINPQNLKIKEGDIALVLASSEDFAHYFNPQKNDEIATLIKGPDPIDNIIQQQINSLQKYKDLQHKDIHPWLISKLNSMTEKLFMKYRDTKQVAKQIEGSNVPDSRRNLLHTHIS